MQPVALSRPSASEAAALTLLTLCFRHARSFSELHQSKRTPATLNRSMSSTSGLGLCRRQAGACKHDGGVCGGHACRGDAICARALGRVWCLRLALV